MKLTKEEAQAAIWEESEDWEVVDKHICDQGRWTTDYEAVLLHKPTGATYCTRYSCGSTETCEMAPFEYDDEVTFGLCSAVHVRLKTPVNRRDVSLALYFALNEGEERFMFAAVETD